MSVMRSMNGFLGPRDIFRNPESVFRYNEPTEGDESPFDLDLSLKKDFAVEGMHFKLGLYEHQSAGAIGGALNLIKSIPNIIKDGNADNIKSIKIKAYEPAFSIIGDPAKMDPQTRQSADHSMAFIISRIFKQAFSKHIQLEGADRIEDFWKVTMLTPHDYGGEALFDETTRSLMSKIQFEHGGKEFDDKYPEGIPSQIEVELADGSKHDSGFVMFPGGHARNEDTNLGEILQHKFKMLGGLALEKEQLIQFLVGLENIQEMTHEELLDIYNCDIKFADKSIDDFE